MTSNKISDFFDSILSKYNYDTESQSTIDILRKMSDGGGIVGAYVHSVDDTFLNLPEYVVMPLKKSTERLAFVKELLDALTLYEISNYNYYLAEFNRFKNELQDLNAKIKSAILYANTYRFYVIAKDLLNSTSLIDWAITTTNVDTLGQRATLPIQGDEKIDVDSITIGGISNGSPGSSLITNGYKANDVQALVDNTPDTWFEYERISTKPVVDSLYLEVLIKLNGPQIINFVEILPSNISIFGSVVLKEVSVSYDGNKFYNVLPEEKAESGYEITTSLYNNTGDFSFIFFPYKANYIKLIFEQTHSYFVELNPNEWVYRQAIGIRDINIAGIRYESKGVFASVDHNFDNKVSQLAVLATTDLTGGSKDVVKFKHFISPTSGNEYYEVSPIDMSSQDIKEVVKFNTLEDDSIKTISDVTKIKYKLEMTVDREAFSNALTPFKAFENTYNQDVFFATIPPNNIELSHIPSPGTVEVYNPKYAAVGKRDGLYYLGTSNGKANQVFEYDLDIEPLSEEVYIDNKRWRRGRFKDASPIARVYSIDYINKKVYFGDDNSGAIPVQGSDIFIRLKAERPIVTNLDPLRIKTKYKTNGDKSSVEINQLYNTEQHIQLLPKNKQVIKLEKDKLQLYTEYTGIWEIKWEWSVYDGDTLESENTTRYVLISSKYFEDQLLWMQTPTSNGTLRDATSITVKATPIDFQTEVVLTPHKYSTGVYYVSLREATGAKGVEIGGEGSYHAINEVPFIDGFSEFSVPGDFSVDYNSGYMYFNSNTPSDKDITATYFYKDVARLADSQWDYYMGKKDEIQIKPGVALVRKLTEKLTESSTNQKVFILENEAIIRGTAKLNSSVFKYEVDFIDGSTEFLNKVQVKDVVNNSDAGNVKLTNDNIYAFILSNKIDTTQKYSFFNTGNTYNVEVNSIDDVINDSNGTAFYVAENDAAFDNRSVIYSSTRPSDEGYIMYVTSRNIEDNAYSIDYDLGVLYTNSSNVEANLLITYEYLDLEIKYYVRKDIDTDSWKLSNNNLTLNIKSGLYPSSGGVVRVSYVFDNEKEQNMSELVDYYTPALKGYEIRVVS